MCGTGGCVVRFGRPWSGRCVAVWAVPGPCPASTGIIDRYVVPVEGADLRFGLPVERPVQVHPVLGDVTAASFADQRADEARHPRSVHAGGLAGHVPT